VAIDNSRERRGGKRDKENIDMKERDKEERDKVERRDIRGEKQGGD
jgi:hypothetical protein